MRTIRKIDKFVKISNSNVSTLLFIYNFIFLNNYYNNSTIKVHFQYLDHLIKYFLAHN